MKKFLLGSVGLAAMLAGPAMAADMRLPPPPPPVVYYDWTGAYIGFNAGGVWNDQIELSPISRAWRVGPGSASNFRTSDSDGIFGFHAGAQWQWGAWVLGVRSGPQRMLQGVRSTSGHLVRSAGLHRQHFCEQQDHQPVHGGPATGLCLGSADDLCDRWLCFGRTSRERIARRVTGICEPAFSQILTGPVAQQRLVCRRRLRLHGPQGPAGRRASSVSSINTSMWARRTRSAVNPGCSAPTGRRL